MLRNRLGLNPETLQDFELAADARYWQGIELALAGHGSAGIYLLGYTAEMLLKLACFRVNGAIAFDSVQPLLGPARSHMRMHHPGVVHEGYHSLLFWMYLLRTRRRSHGRALAGPLDWELVRSVRRLYQIWWVEMRYRPDNATEQEVHWVYNDVSWLRDHYVLLWR